jgi:uncharacterized membrane protein YphA (DoxX/SURF4 family)
LVLRLAIASVFLFAGLEKWRGAEPFMEQIANYQFYPELSPWAALLLPPFEVVSALAVLFMRRRWRQAGAVVIIGMLLVFTFAMARAWSLGINIECGCFGKGSPNIGPLSFARNGLLVAVCLAILWLDRERPQVHSITEPLT